MSTSLFAYGFRCNFLLAGIAAVVLVPWWAASFALGAPLGTDWPPTLWHSHEMIFGFIGAVIAGFLLTAVPSWTGQRGFAGRPLVILSALWLAGRLLIASSALWPRVLVALTDLAFLPALGVLIAPGLVRSRNRNTPLLGVIGFLWLMDVAFHRSLAYGDLPLAGRMLQVAIDLALVLVTVIGGRVIPSFTAAALKRRGVEGEMHRLPGLTPVTVGMMVVIAIGDGVWPGSAANGWLAAGAALAHCARLLQWRTVRTLREPIVWVLHLAYSWLPVGLALKALALVAGSGVAAFWLHALTVGAITTMILAMMTRVSLGHTGRPLVVDPAITLAYVLLAGAAVVRVFGLWLWGGAYPAVILSAAFLWTAAFALFLWIYVPILMAPRVDGKPG